jgi:2-polyprenyl-6-methoxyphenol hydroxylase-like FAD-dependent oxidoreductase
MSAIKLKVMISGAGIAGPCLAYWLSKSGLETSITIIERSPTPRVAGQSIDIRGPAIEIIKKMQIKEKIRSRHTTEECTRFKRIVTLIFLIIRLYFLLLTRVFIFLISQYRLDIDKFNIRDI